MLQQHPITPPPELLQQWAVDYWGNPGESIGKGEKYIATQAARWGADQELEASCEWIAANSLHGAESDLLKDLRATRRPKPPSLAEQALIAHRRIWDEGINHTDCGLILRALERLQELENNG